MSTIQRAREFGGREALAQYAKVTSPETQIPYRVYLTHTPTCIALHDKFPKSKFHFIILPRLPFRIPQSARSTEDDTAMIFVAADRLHDLRALAKSEKALEVLLQLKACSEEVVSLIQEEMVAQEGRTWPISVGFHANESMPHLHLHVISQDFDNIWLKQPKHWNSFSPSHGFFLHLDDIIAAARSKKLESRIPAQPTADRLLKEDMRCHRSACKARFGKDVAALRSHLQQHFVEDVKEVRRQPLPTSVAPAATGSVGKTAATAMVVDEGSETEDDD